MKIRRKTTGQERNIKYQVWKTTDPKDVCEVLDIGELVQMKTRKGGIWIDWHITEKDQADRLVRKHPEHYDYEVLSKEQFTKLYPESYGLEGQRGGSRKRPIKRIIQSTWRIAAKGLGIIKSEWKWFITVSITLGILIMGILNYFFK